MQQPYGQPSYGQGQPSYGRGQPSYGQPSYGQLAYSHPTTIAQPTYSYPQKKELSDCGRCVQYLLITGNVFFWMVACAVLGVGVWIIVEKNYMSIIYGNVLMTVAAYLIVIAAGGMFLISGFGCLGAIARNKVLLVIYFCALIGIGLFLFVGAILAIVYRTEIDNEVHEYMRVTLERDYGVNVDEQPYNRAVTEAWDQAQRELYCCSVLDKSWKVYEGSEWYKTYHPEPGEERPFVPKSCCKMQNGEYVNLQKCQTEVIGPPGGDDVRIYNPALHYRGCYGAGKDFIMDYSAALIGMGIGLLSLIIIGSALSLMLSVMLPKKKPYI